MWVYETGCGFFDCQYVCVAFNTNDSTHALTQSDPFSFVSHVCVCDWEGEWELIHLQFESSISQLVSHWRAHINNAINARIWCIYVVFSLSLSLIPFIWSRFQSRIDEQRQLRKNIERYKLWNKYSYSCISHTRYRHYTTHHINDWTIVCVFHLVVPQAVEYWVDLIFSYI